MATATKLNHSFPLNVSEILPLPVLSPQKSIFRVCKCSFHVCSEHHTLHMAFHHHLSLSPPHFLKVPFDPEQEIWLSQIPAFQWSQTDSQTLTVHCSQSQTVGVAHFAGICQFCQYSSDHILISHHLPCNSAARKMADLLLPCVW